MLLKIRSGGFIVLEFAIALPLLILVMYGLAIVSVNIFKLGKEQLADYVLEAEARYVMESITQKARVAKEIDIDSSRNKLKIVYHAVDDWKDANRYYNETLKDAAGGFKHRIYGARDVLETQYFFNLQDSSGYAKLYAKRQDDENYTTPTTGNDSISQTNIISLKYDDSDKDKKILRIELEMESKVSKHKIKIATAVFMPSCESLVIEDE